MKITWTLPSSDGWNAFCGTIQDRFTLEDGRDALLTELSLSGDFWCRDLWEQGEHTSDLTPDFHLQLPQFVLDKGKLKLLLEELNAWFSKPKEIEVELAAARGQQLSISFRVDKDYECKIDSPVCAIRCSSDRLRQVEVKFVVDQSCIRIFSDELQNSLSS